MRKERLDRRNVGFADVSRTLSSGKRKMLNTQILKDDPFLGSRRQLQGVLRGEHVGTWVISYAVGEAWP